jgi:hypothetical protein
MLVAAVLAPGSVAPPAFGDEPVDRPEAFDVDRETPPIGRAELGFDAGAPITGWAVGMQIGYLDRPMRLHTTTVRIFPVERRETLSIGGAFALGDAFVVDARMPFSVQAGDRMQGLGDERPLDAWVPGDLGVGARLRVAKRERVQLFVRGHLTFGTGDDRDFAGEARFTAAWNLIARFTLPAGFVVAATAGVRFRRAEVLVADRLLGDELAGGIGATYELPAIRGLWCAANRVRVTAEVVGVLGDDVANQRGPSPVEGRVGMISRIRPWLAIAMRVGKGLDDQIGAPRFRAMFELVYEGNAR